MSSLARDPRPQASPPVARGIAFMKLSDTYGWTPDTALGQLALEGQDLDSYQAFWHRSAKVDAIRAIADQDSDESFTSSGIEAAVLAARRSTPPRPGRRWCR
jgi:hypothetical protein